MFRRTLALFALITFAPAVALADDVGPAGHITELHVNQTSADGYLAFHGRVFIADKKSENEYRWGGTSCGQRVLSEHQVALLSRALESGLRVQPRTKIGQGSVVCLVGFSLMP